MNPQPEGKSMARMQLTEALREEYRKTFETAAIRPGQAGAVKTLAGRILAPSRLERYQAVSRHTGVPGHVVGILHALEAGLDFTRHLHNGDPLAGRTVRVPKGRPANGQPPFAWEASAADALALAGLGDWTDWSVPGTAYALEGYNGFGYRRRNVPSPYLWSFTTAYVSGKYVADHAWSPTAVSRQCGGMTLLRAMRDAGDVVLEE